MNTLTGSASPGHVRWRLEYRHMSSPAARLLQADGKEPGAVFALFGKVGRSPRVYTVRDREGFLRTMQTAALSKMGITLAGKLSQSQSHALAAARAHLLERTCLRIQLANLAGA